MQLTPMRPVHTESVKQFQAVKNASILRNPHYYRSLKNRKCVTPIRQKTSLPQMATRLIYIGSHTVMRMPD